MAVDSTAAPADTAARADSSAQQDSIKIPQPDSVMRLLEKRAGPLGEKVIYSGEKITFFPSENVVLIRGQASVESGPQRVSTDSLIAYNRNTGEIFVSGSPQLTDGPDQLTGSRVRYNMERNRGIIEQGKTEFTGWFLESETLSKIGADSIFGRKNIFTTCDLEEAKHFHFESSRIKVIRNKRAFASPVILKIGKVPVFALPFVFFPITSGNRNSGPLQPRIGVNSIARDRITGRTFGNLGYFWAPNDYMDFLGAVDIRTSSQITFRGRTRYRKRYSYDGNFDIRRVSDKINNSTDLSIFGRHNQTIGERGRLNAEINYTSSRDLLRRTGYDQQDLLRQSLRSTASFSLRPSWGYFTSSARHEKFLSQNRTVAILPSISLSLNRRTLFRYKSKTVPSQRGLLSSGWLYNITYGLSTDYSNTRTTEKNDTTRVVSRSNSRFEINSPQTLYGWLKFNPALRYSTQLVHDNLRIGDQFNREQFLNVSTSASTQIFGFFDGPRLGPIFRWRHTIRPRITYTFQPDLSSDHSRRKTSRASFTVSNDVDYKYYQQPRTEADSSRTDADSTGTEADTSRTEADTGKPAQEKTGKLFSLRNSLSYDFVRAAKRDTLGWGNLNTSLTSHPTSFLNLQLLMNHELVERGQREHLKPFMSSLSTTLTFRGTYKADRGREPSIAELEEEVYLESTRYPGTIGNSFDFRGRDYADRRDMAFSRAMPWTINISHNLRRYRMGRKADQSLRWSFTFNPTPKWHLIYRSSYNFRSRGLQGQSFTLNRDLHCWQANLSLITLSNGRFEFVFSTYLRNNPAIRVPDVRRASN